MVGSIRSENDDVGQLHLRLAQALLAVVGDGGCRSPRGFRFVGEHVPSKPRSSSIIRIARSGHRSVYSQKRPQVGRILSLNGGSNHGAKRQSSFTSTLVGFVAGQSHPQPE